jgi:hypothetical protein
MSATQEPVYDVFISYRRGAADELALLLQKTLQQRGLNVFVDRDLRRGRFDNTLPCRIAEAPSFLVILTPHALDRCREEEDWLRKEIVQAIGSQRNIIPLQVDSFQFAPELVRNLDPAIRDLSKYQTVEYSRTYFESTIDRIVRIVEEDKTERRVAEEIEQRRLASKRNEEKKEQERVEREQIEAHRLAELKRLSHESEERRRLSIETNKREKREPGAPKYRSAVKVPQPHRLRMLAWATIIIMVIAILITGIMWLFSSLKSPRNEGLTEPQSSSGRSYPSQRATDVPVVHPISTQSSISQPAGQSGARRHPPKEKPFVPPTIKDEVTGSADDERRSTVRKTLDLANRQRDGGHYRDAIRTYNEVLKLDPNNPEAKTGLVKAQQAAEWEVSN